MVLTDRAAQSHALRVHHQVSTWPNLRTVFDLIDYGFTVSDNIVSLVITDKAPPKMNCYVKSAVRVRAALHYANPVLAASTTSLQHTLQLQRTE